MLANMLARLYSKSAATEILARLYFSLADSSRVGRRFPTIQLVSTSRLFLFFSVTLSDPSPRLHTHFNVLLVDVNGC